MKVSKSSQRKLENKIVKLEEKVIELQKKNRVKSKKTAYLNKRIKALTESRDKWKSKNVSKTKQIKLLRKSRNPSQKIKRHHYPLFLVSLCIHLRIIGGCSYRSIRRILQILHMCSVLELEKFPCANTVQNWVSKTGHYCIKNVADSLNSREFCLIIDESMNQGNERSMLMLLTPLHPSKDQALTYQDVRICYLAGKTSWTGDKIKTEVLKLMDQEDIEIKMVLSDQDSKLLKAVRLLGLPHLPDINHAVASCLRKTFEKNEDYIGLLKQISAYQYKSVNQSLSYLRPCKQRVKARFMNQKGVIKWGNTMLKNFDKLNEKEQIFFSQLPEHQSILKLLDECLQLAEGIVLPMKTKGLSDQTIKQAEQLLCQKWFASMNFEPIIEPINLEEIKQQPDASIPYMISKNEDIEDLLGIFLKHLQSYLDIYRKFLKTNKGVYNVSTDVIESLFGKYKLLKANNPFIGISKIDLELPVYCMKNEQIDQLAKKALETTSLACLEKFITDHSSDNQLVKRRRFFENGT